jgi:hypothetical protein
MGNASASQRLLAPNPRLETRWHSGRRTPVTLRLEFPAPVRAIEFCPSLLLRSEADGEVALVVVDADTGRRTAFLGHWQDARWCAVALPWDARRVRVEFVTRPSTWIALRAVRAGVIDERRV